MKKKIITLCLVIAMLSVAVIGGTLAYFTDVDQARNEFTVGRVSIDLWEDVDHVDGAGNEKDEEEFPGVVTLGQGTDGKETHKYESVMPGDILTKKVTVLNDETEDAYVAIAIKQLNYGNAAGLSTAEWQTSKYFNNRIDNYYEGARETQLGLPPVEVAEMGMQAIIDDIFTGTGWNGLSYDKTTNGFGIRYYPANFAGLNEQAKVDTSYVGNTSEEAILLAVDYAVAEQSEYTGNMMPQGTYKTNIEAGSRIWVYYLYLPAGAQYTLDLTVECPYFIDEVSIEAFENMVLDVRASAIQVSGFETARAAFVELNETYPLAYSTTE